MNFGVLHSMDFARGRMEEFLCLQEGKGTVKADSPLEECRKVPYKPEELSLSHVSLLAVFKYCLDYWFTKESQKPVSFHTVSLLNNRTNSNIFKSPRCKYSHIYWHPGKLGVQKEVQWSYVWVICPHCWLLKERQCTKLCSNSCFYF